MAKNVYPSMDIGGFITDDKQIATRLIQDWYATNHSQTIMFQNTIKSAPYLSQQHGHEPEIFVSNVESELRALYDAYLYGVSIEVGYRYFDENDHSRYETRINIRFYVEGEQLSLTTALIVNKNILERLLEITYRE